MNRATKRERLRRVRMWSRLLAKALRWLSEATLACCPSHVDSPKHIADWRESDTTLPLMSEEDARQVVFAGRAGNTATNVGRNGAMNHGQSRRSLRRGRSVEIISHSMLVAAPRENVERLARALGLEISGLHPHEAANKIMRWLKRNPQARMKKR